MFLKSLKINNFRNYSSLDFKFKTPITVLVGDNAQGKSNFLESIYFLATGKSTRAERDEELVKVGEEVLRVEGKLKSGTQLEIVMQLVEGNLNKRVKVNGVGKKIADYSQNLVVLLFAPEDINLVAGSPSLRRTHIDSFLSQVDREYKRSLSRYEEVVIKKNKVLKAIRDQDASLDQLIFWLEQQVDLGQKLTSKRQNLFNFLNNTEKKFGEFEYQYISSPISLSRLNEYQTKEIDAAASLIGPHRDDFRFVIANSEGVKQSQSLGIGIASSTTPPRNDGVWRDLAHFGSRGEQRTAVLDLKLLEINFIEQTLGDRPILLLDDIFSELDHDHAQHVLNLANLQQTIITAIELDEHIKDKFDKQAKILKVEQGKIP